MTLYMIIRATSGIPESFTARDFRPLGPLIIGRGQGRHEAETHLSRLCGRRGDTKWQGSVRSMLGTKLQGYVMGGGGCGIRKCHEGPLGRRSVNE